MSNRKIGNSFEAEFCKMLFDKGFWVHNLTQNSAGQPADVIAVKHGKSFLIDCKVCENDRFLESRIEPNQRTAMQLWRMCGNGEGWFALQLTDKSVWFIDYELMTALFMNASSINADLIRHYGQPFERWVERC